VTTPLRARGGGQQTPCEGERLRPRKDKEQEPEDERLTPCGVASLLRTADDVVLIEEVCRCHVRILPYPAGFKAEAVHLAQSSDKSIPALAAGPGVSSEALRHWLRQVDADSGRGQPDDLMADEREGFWRLRREVKALQQERRSSEKRRPTS